MQQLGEAGLQFLAQLADNNNKAFFTDNKPRYEELVRSPALAFITAMQPVIGELSQQFLVSPKKVGGSLMRVYRDTRFSKDKTPYKTNIGIQFRHLQGKDVHAPGFYVHIANDGCFLGVGCWHPDGKALAAIRAFIDENPRSWQEITRQSEFANRFPLSGESLVRPPRGFDKQHPLLEDLKRKDFIGIAEFDPQQLDGDFVGFCGEQFRHSAEFMRYLCAALSLPW